MLTGYEDPEFSIYEGCPVEAAMSYSYLWEFCVDVSNSGGFKIPEMTMCQAHAYNAFITDRNIAEEQRREAARKRRNK